MENIITVQKEQINSLKFFPHEVITEKVRKNILQFDLNRALILGNTDHNKVTIVFKDEGGVLLQVITTIWAVTESYIILKGGANIPIKAIAHIVF